VTSIGGVVPPTNTATNIPFATSTLGMHLLREATSPHRIPFSYHPIFGQYHLLE
jgi:hypothetical protein